MNNGENEEIHGEKEEMHFWDKELSLKGKFTKYIMRRLDPKLRKEDFPEKLLELSFRSFSGEQPYQVLELGSGPLSTLAYGVDIGLIEVVAIDPLADAYASLYKKYNIMNFPIKPIQGAGEALNISKKFHCAFAINSLDHTTDIVKSFNNLVMSVRMGGCVILQHHIKEGSYQRWSESHKWDLDVDNDQLIANDRNGNKYILTTNLKIVFLNVDREKRGIEIVIQKL